jgi:hypothetical protein
MYSPKHPNSARRKFSSVVLLSFIAVLLSSCGSDKGVQIGLDATDAENPVRILFIGNSYTFYNDMPYILEELARASDPPLYVETTMVVEGGESLRGHWERGIAQEHIRTGTYDVVVLQGVSGFDYQYFVEGSRRFGIPDVFHDYSRRFSKMAKESGALPAFFSTWIYDSAPEEDGLMIDYAYMTIAQELNAKIAQVGRVWREALETEPSLRLYNPDRSHPSSTGSYLAAVVFFTTLFGKNPEGLPSSLLGPPSNTSGVRVYNDRPLIQILSQSDAELIQSIAWETQKQLEESGGYYDLERPKFPIPVLPNGEKKVLDDLPGRWVGKLNAYPKYLPWPAKMEFLLAKSGEGWNLDLSLNFDGELFEKDVIELELTETSISFIDPNGPDGSIVRYQGVFLDDKIQGKAELIKEGAAFYAVGSWEIVKQ